MVKKPHERLLRLFNFLSHNFLSTKTANFAYILMIFRHYLLNFWVFLLIFDFSQKVTFFDPLSSPDSLKEPHLGIWCQTFDTEPQNVLLDVSRPSDGLQRRSKLSQLILLLVNEKQLRVGFLK